MPPEQSIEDRVRSASYHEAGHAVALRHFGRELASIAIDPQTGGGATRCNSGQDLSSDQTIIVLESAYVCMDVFGVSPSGDWDSAEDMRMVLELLEARFPDDTKAQERQRQLLVQAARELFATPNVRAAAQALADELALRTTLTGDRAHAIIDFYLPCTGHP